MKGIVFTTLSEIVEKRHGIIVLDEVLQTISPTDNGAYTTGKDYPDEELQRFMATLCAKTQVGVNEYLDLMGQEIHFFLYRTYYEHKGLRCLDYMQLIKDFYIVEINKLSTDTKCKVFTCENINDHTILYTYQSDRKLCPFLMGIFHGVEKSFHKKFTITQPQCMLLGSDQCKILIEIGD